MSRNRQGRENNGDQKGYGDGCSNRRHGVEGVESRTCRPSRTRSRNRYIAPSRRALIAALHARRPDDQATCNADIYRRINGLIRERCDIIINNSTGGGSSGDMLVPRPDGMFESSSTSA